MRRASGKAGSALESWVAARALADASRTLLQLRLVRGASRRTQRRMARAAAMMVAAAGLLGSAPAHAATPQFVATNSGFAFGDVGSMSKPTVVDIDGDGDLDAFIGTASGSTVFFENTGTAAAAAFATASVNPFGLADVGNRSAPAFADIDGDGDLDAFIGEVYGTLVFFANTGSSAAPAFAASSANPFGLTGGYVGSPTFADIDGDGDLDAFVGDLFGSTAFFANTGSSAAPAFAVPSANPFGLAGVGNYSSPTFADIDGDGDLDAFLGQLSGNSVFFANTGSSAAPAFAASSANPFGLADVGYNSSPTFADIDGDGDLDAFSGEVSGRTFFFANTGSSAAPAFAAFAANPFGLPDVGYSSSPTFADIDGDSDLDAFIGEAGGDIIFFANTGSSAAPAFAASSANPFGLVDVKYDSSPTFADIDGDGDLDAFVGERYGYTIFFENTGSSAAPAFAASSANPFGLVDIGSYSSPAFADIDGDGDLDAFVGTYYGSIKFFENTGSSAAPAFAASSASPFGLPSNFGYWSSPTFADIDGDGDLDAFIGQDFGNTIFAANTGSSAAPAFAAAVTNPFGLADVGFHSSPTFADIDGDGDLDAFLGEDDGPTFFFENRQGVACPTTPSTCQEGFGKALLLVKEKTLGKEKVIAKFVQGPALTQAAFGDPRAADGTAYRLCIYGDDDALVASLTVDRAGDSCAGSACWASIGAAPPAGKGFQYKDKDAAADGVKLLKLKGGDAGKSLLLFKAANNASKGQLALPTGISAALAGATSATVQLHSNDASCFSADLSTVTKADADSFKAQN